MAKEECYSVLCLFLISCVGCVLGNEFVETGKNHTFKPLTSGTIKNIDWRCNNGENLVVEWDYRTEVTWYKYKNQAFLDTNTGELTISDLKKSDSGRFDLTYHTGGPVKSVSFTIKVMDGVTKPSVACKVIDKNITLHCSVNPLVPANFTWRGPGGWSSAGASLHVTRQENDDDSVYFCTASNEVSKETTDVTLQLCPKNPQPNVGVIVGVIIAILVLGAAGAVLFYVKQRNGARRVPVSTQPDQSS